MVLFYSVPWCFMSAFPLEVYVTGIWQSGIEGSFDTLFADLKAANISVFDWTKPEHRARPFSKQSEAITTDLSK